MPDLIAQEGLKPRKLEFRITFSEYYVHVTQHDDVD